ncbi:DUF4328 domain-containing protein [Kribbella sp.]|uniref:DUF4328 domain-containing protein n=1 Tax=Kribbella sp. TaxID=1871183 RepID=UPI002D7197DE|nr:DUF4328 domain-containing protein [Kribbella sp.]HZX07538.1 DUF4328 domain-containing protein [Kribbella sp.]
MTQPYPGPGPYQPGPGQFQPGPYQPVPYQPVLPQFRPLRTVAIASMVLMGLTVVAAVVQCVLLWRSYDQVKRLVYGLLSDAEIERGARSIAGTGPFLDLIGYLLIGTAIAFLLWLWRARDNADFLNSPFAPQPMVPEHYLHRRAPGWVIGSWFCPIVQFWYPFQIVDDVVRASKPPAQPDGRIRTLLYGWWATWTGFWVIVVGGGSVAVVEFIVWIVRLVQATDNGTGGYVDIYDLQDFMVHVALAVDIGFTVATALLIVAGVAMALLMRQIGDWQQERMELTPAQGPVQPPLTPQYAPRPQHPGPGFPTYGR